MLLAFLGEKGFGNRRRDFPILDALIETDDVNVRAAKKSFLRLHIQRNDAGAAKRFDPS